jgi:putative hydrolase of the HAD superfamily
MKEIKAIIFDLGGVMLSRGLWLFREYLVNNYGVTDEQTVEVFIRKYYKQYFLGNMTEQDFWNSSLSDLGIDEDYRELKRILLNFYTPNIEMFNLVEKLSQQGYKLYLLSDQTNDWWPELNGKYEISSYFDKSFISSEVKLHKPEREFYLYVLNSINLSASETLFIDDLESNLVPAEELGMNTVLYTDTEDLIKKLDALLMLSVS